MKLGSQRIDNMPFLIVSYTGMLYFDVYLKTVAVSQYNALEMHSIFALYMNF